MTRFVFNSTRPCIGVSVCRCVVCGCGERISGDVYMDLLVYGHCVKAKLDLKVDLQDFWSSVRWNLKCPSMTVSAVVTFLGCVCWV